MPINDAGKTLLGHIKRRCHSVLRRSYDKDPLANRSSSH